MLPPGPTRPSSVETDRRSPLRSSDSDLPSHARSAHAIAKSRKPVNDHPSASIDPGPLQRAAEAPESGASIDRSDTPCPVGSTSLPSRHMSESSVPLTGGCNCRAVRFEISEPLLGAAYCHCTRCQRRTGTAASPSAAVKPGTFRIVSGEDHIRRWNAGDGTDKVFCGTCGSHLFSQDPKSPEMINVRMGSFDGDPGLRPTGRVHVASAAAWEPIPDDGLI